MPSLGSLLPLLRNQASGSVSCTSYPLFPKLLPLSLSLQHARLQLPSHFCVYL